MKKNRYILPVLVSTRLLAQQEQVIPNVEFGFTNGTFVNVTTITNSGAAPAPHPQRDAMMNKSPQTRMNQVTYGFNYGVFLWVKVNDRINIKPELNASFSNYKFEERARPQTSIYATSVDLTVANQAVINLKPVNTHGIIKAAKCMSYYLTTKQPYVLVGPKLSYRKFDQGFLQRGYQNEASMGIVVGYGVNYGFHNMNVAPEIKYSIESSSQNAVDNKKKIIHTITLAINMF